MKRLTWVLVAAAAVATAGCDHTGYTTLGGGNAHGTRTGTAARHGGASAAPTGGHAAADSTHHGAASGAAPAEVPAATPPSNEAPH